MIYIGYNLLQFITFQIINEDINLLNANSIPGITPIDIALREEGYFIGTSHLQSIQDLYSDHAYSSIFIILALGSLILSYLKFSEMES